MWSLLKRKQTAFIFSSSFLSSSTVVLGMPYIFMSEKPSWIHYNVLCILVLYTTGFPFFLSFGFFFSSSSRMLSVRENSESMSGLYAFDIRFPLLKIYKFSKYSSIRLVLPSFHPNKLRASKDWSALKKHEKAWILWTATHTS